MEKNVRIHPEKQIREYMRSLEAFEQTKPMIIDETGLILVGNGLYEAMRRLGLETAECNLIEGLTEAQKKKLMLADNKVFELGVTDTDAFQDILKELDSDFDIPGYDASMLEMLQMSLTEVDDYISGYGSFETEDVERIRQKPPETHTEGVATGFPAYSAPAPLSNLAPAEVDEGSVGNGAEAAQTGRYIICPRCGERIPLGGA
jgi:hypothetical protein